ncbi:MAG: PAS domain-containing protein [Alphaproteobacteria bacterium]|nr:PAS domain-containing protein [Alphaproteobacteria bacterium]
MNQLPPGVDITVDPAHLANPTLAVLLDYWNAKRGARPMPARKDIRPNELKEHLGWVNLVDVLPGGQDFRYRLIGTLVTEYFLAESTGQTVSQAFARWGSAVQSTVLQLFSATARNRKVIHASGAPNTLARGFEAYESLFFPLSDDGETVNVIMNAFVFDRPDVLLARQIAKANGGKLVPRAKRLKGAA